jgi:iron only hydrogenase large subunit-like protein
MACPAGCINGGGQPYAANLDETIEQRIRGLYHVDRNKVIRKSHMNPSIQTLYQEFLGDPGSHLAHEILHDPDRLTVRKS